MRMWRKENPVLTVALFTTVKIQKRPKCPWMEEWIKKMWYIHRIFLSHKKKPMKSSMKLRSGSLGGKKKSKMDKPSARIIMGKKKAEGPNQ